MLRKIVETGEAGVTDYVQRFFESFGYGEYPEDVNARAYYMQGIGHKALGDESRAAECFRKALEQRNDHLWANYYLGMIRETLSSMFNRGGRQAGPLFTLPTP